eukprot:scaffold1299_cov385-Pavlova_lutheri.AAC.8
MDLEEGEDGSGKPSKWMNPDAAVRKGERTIALDELPTGLANELRVLDEDGNGVLSLDEIQEGVKRLRSAKEQLGLAKKIIIFLAILTLVQISAIVGVVYALLVSLKDTDVDSHHQLVVKGTNVPVTVANPDIRVGTTNYTSAFPESMGNARILLEEHSQLVDAQGSPIATATLVGENGHVLTPQGQDASIATVKYYASASEIGGFEALFNWTAEELGALEMLVLVVDNSTISLAVQAIDFKRIEVDNSLEMEAPVEDDLGDDVNSTFEALLITVEHYQYKMLFLLRVYETDNPDNMEHFMWALDDITEALDFIIMLEAIKDGGVIAPDEISEPSHTPQRRVMCSVTNIKKCFRKIKDLQNKVSRLEGDIKNIQSNYNSAMSSLRSFADISRRAGQSLAGSIANLQSIRGTIQQVPNLIENILLAFEWVPAQCSPILIALEQIILNGVGKQCIPYGSIFPDAFGSSITIYEKPNVFKMEASLQPTTCFELVEFKPKCPGIQTLLTDMNAIVRAAIKDAFVVLRGEIQNMLNLDVIRPLDNVISSLRSIQDLLSQISTRRRLGARLTSESPTQSEVWLSQVYEHCHSHVEREIHRRLEYAAKQRQLFTSTSFTFDALRIKVETRMSASLSFEGFQENFYSVDLLRELGGGALPFVTQSSIPLYPALSLAIATSFDVRLLFQTYMSASAQGMGAVSTGGLTFDVDLAKRVATVSRGDPSRDLNLDGTARTSVSLGIDFQPTASIGLCVGLGAAACLTTEILAGVGGAIGGDQIMAASVGAPQGTVKLSTFFTPDVSYEEENGSCVLGANAFLAAGGAWAHFPPPFARAKLKAPGLNDDLFQWEHSSPLVSTVLFQQCSQDALT